MKNLKLVGLAYLIILASCNQSESGTSREKSNGIENRNIGDKKGIDSGELADASKKVTVTQMGSDENENENEELTIDSSESEEQREENPVELDKYKNWMELAFTDNQDTKIRNIVIPGTHNSGTLNISVNSNFANGSEINHRIFKIIQSIPLLNNFADNQVKDIFSNWSRTQNKSIANQLTDGIRFFDLRVAPSKETGAFMIVHGQESIELSTALTEIMNFVKANPKEIVFLKSKVSYDYSVSVSNAKKTETQQNMEWMINKDLEPFTYNQDANDASIADIWASSRSIILLNDNNLTNAWGQIHSNQQETLLQNIDSYLASGLPAKFVEICLCLTPEDDDIIGFIAEKYKVDGLVDFVGGAVDKGKEIFDSIFLTDDTIALGRFQSGLHSRLISNMNQWQQKKYRMNILSVDFYDELKFIDKVIQMNKSLAAQ